MRRATPACSPAPLATAPRRAGAETLMPARGEGRARIALLALVVTHIDGRARSRLNHLERGQVAAIGKLRARQQLHSNRGCWGRTVVTPANGGSTGIDF